MKYYIVSNGAHQAIVQVPDGQDPLYGRDRYDLVAGPFDTMEIARLVNDDQMSIFNAVKQIWTEE